MTTGPRRLRALVVATVLLGCVPFGMLPAAASTLDVPTALEAWFQVSPVEDVLDPLCASPAGCPVPPVAPAPPYPEDTLHVGATSGRTDAVTYIAFATSTLPVGAELTGGTAVLPVASAEDGTVAADTAELRACLVTQRFEPAAGAPREEAPEPDCDVTAPARYVAEDDDSPRLEVELAPFVAGWKGPGAVAGLALVPTEDAVGTWHVAFSGRERQQEGAAPPITAQLTYRTATDSGGALPDPFGSSGSSGSGPGTTASSEGSSSLGSGGSSFSGGTASAPSAPVAQGSSDAAELLPEVADAEPGPSVSTPTPELQPVAAPATAAYPYPVVWLLPLAFAFGGILLARSLTGEVEVLADDDPRDLIGRLWLAFFPDRGTAT